MPGFSPIFDLLEVIRGQSHKGAWVAIILGTLLGSSTIKKVKFIGRDNLSSAEKQQYVFFKSAFVCVLNLNYVG